MIGFNSLYPFQNQLTNQIFLLAGGLPE